MNVGEVKDIHYIVGALLR